MRNSSLTVFVLLLLRWSTVATSTVPFAEVKIMQNGTAIAGDTSFSLICCATLPQGIQDEEQLTVNFSTPVTFTDTDYSVHRINDSVIDGNCCTYTSVLRFTILKTSHGGEYTCTVTSIMNTMASNTTTVNVQIPTPLLTMSRAPDASVTLRHGDLLNLTCTIELDQAVDIDVTVTGTLSEKGILNPIFDAVKNVSSNVYQINRTIASLKAARSTVYSCNATVSPGPGVANVTSSGQTYSMLNITVELFVSISVSYTPPPGFIPGPNEYRAASGPVIVNCNVTGGTSISYKWSSNCRCPFQTATSETISRGAVHSGDIGTHTCTATAAESVGNASINVTVVGAGIHVFRGIPTGTFSNNSLVSLNPMDSKFRLQFFCRSDSMMEDVGKLIGLDGSSFVTHDRGFFNISKTQPGELYVENIANSTDLTASGQGVYTCRIPLQSGGMMDISIGIYPSGFTVPPRITNLAFTDGSSSSFLTCTSTGSAATTVTWMRDGQPLIIDGGTYQLTQTVTDRADSSYENVLTIMEELSTVVEHHYSCLVSNINGNASEHLNLTANPLHVAIMQEENTTAGRSFSLNCSLILPKWAKALEKPNITFLNPVNIAGDRFIMIKSSEEMLNDGFKYITTLKFTALQISHGKQYKCQAHFRSQTAENESSLVVKISPPTVSVAPADNDILYAGSSLTLICTISLQQVPVDFIGITVDITWTGPRGNLFLDDSNGRIVITGATKEGGGSYRSMVMFKHLHTSDTGSYSCGARVSHMSEFISSSDPVTSDVMIRTVKAPVVTVTGTVSPDPIRGLVTAGRLFSISCTRTITGADNLEARFQFTLTAQRNNTIINTTDDTHLLHSFTARVSDAGTYLCKLNVTSTFLEEAIIQSKTVTLTIQIPAPALTMSRDPDNSMTLRHGDPLHLTCIIELDLAVDIDVNVVGTLSGQGIQTSSGTVEPIHSRVYQIKKTIVSLKASKSTEYTCNATVSPDPRVVNIISSEKTCSVLNIAIEIAVKINVSYIPPTGFEPGPNEYRAASGPIKVTCIAVGGTPTVRYQWSSTCRDCPFQESKPKSNSSAILRVAVHSGDTGIHTCTATDTTGNTGINSTSFNITGVGIHVFSGEPRGSLLNNGLVVSNDSDSKFHLRFFCRSDSMSNNTGELIGLHNSTLTSSRPFNISTPQPGELLVFVDNHTHLTLSHQGVYTCRTSMQNGDVRKINIGIYPSGFKGAPIITSVTYRLEKSSSDLTCNSITSPPTTVTWIIGDAMFTLRDGESVTMNRVKYGLKQTVTNRRTSAYASTLTIHTVLAEDITGYRCIVNNTLGGDSKAVGEGTFSIRNIPSGTQTAGEMYSLTCSIAVTEGVVDTLTAHWSGPGVNTDGVTATNLSILTLGILSTFTLDLTFTPLRQSHDGDYTCRADLATFIDSSNTGVVTTVPLVTVQISGGRVVKFEESLALHCAISGVNNLHGNITFQWRGPNKTRLESTSPRLELSTVSFSDAGIYTCTATVSSAYLNDDILENNTVNVNVSVPSPDVAIDHDGRSTINAGSVLILYCIITLDRRVAQNELLIVTTMWSGPHGELGNETRITVMKEQGTSGQHFSNVIFNTIHVGDSGNYSCQANVSHIASQFILQGMNTSVTTVAVQAPNVTLSLTLNTTRLPNVHPYNTFSLTCTATAPKGVVSPKNFTWWRRRNAAINNNVARIYYNETIQITNSDLDQPMSTSVLTVTETTSGDWYYHCNVALMELINVTNETASHLITVTRPVSPEPPVDLLTDSVTTDSANISWIVTTIAFTPETYVVHYGTSMDMLSNMSDPITGLSNFATMNYKFSITLTALTPNTMYFYRINSTNSNGSVLSQPANFITGLYQVPPPTVSVVPADNDIIYAGSSLTLICTISLNRVSVDLIGITVDGTWTGPHGKLDGRQNGRIIAAAATKGADGSYRSTVVITPLHMSDTGNYSCDAGVSHTSEFILSSDVNTSNIMINVIAPAVTVIGIVSPMNGVGTAGELFSITCMITGADNLEARFNFSLIAGGNNTVIHHDAGTSEIHSIHNFTARASDAGMYTCKVTVTSSFLDEPITSMSTAVTLSIQSTSGTNAIIAGCVVGVTLLTVVVIAIVVASIRLKGRKHCEELTTANHTDLVKHKTSKEDIQTSECAAYHQVICHSATDEQPHATDIAEQNPVYENAQPETVESPVYEVISQV